MSAKYSLIIANGTGIIDMDYGGEIMICLHKPYNDDDALRHHLNLLGENHNNKREFILKKGDRIAQISLVEHKSYLFGIESETKRDGGFGSTDKESEQKNVHGDNLDKTASMLNNAVHEDYFNCRETK